uniref:NB-ARC domain-containing protein n=1 Tax=Oryza meridionalis TaxID=40149 RepID=A0A0E0E4A0_9ORYZ
MVGFGEMIASAVLKELLRKLSSPIWQTIMSQVNLNQDLEAIKSVLGSLQAKLSDAERKSQTDGSVRDLLKKLKAVAYDIEDMLAMKKMRRRLEGIKKEMDLTSFMVDGATEEQDSYISRHLEPRRYSSEDTVGRIAEKGRIMDLLLSDEEHSIIPIYGLGGLENNFKLDELEAMLRLCKKGSKVIVTTRSKKVADRMNKDLQIELGLLPNEDCWTLFRKKARVSTPVPRYMEAMRETIVEKCQGLPLAVKSLGYFLGRMRPTEWEQNLHSNIWAEKDDRFPDNGVIANLKLSYYSMPCSLRLCFAYLSVFPKGSHIQKSSLIQQWIALGFIQPPESVLTEQYAEYCLQELIEMSFLQNVNVPTAMFARYTRPQNVLKMHDIVHDLASVVAADEVRIFHASDCSSSNTENCCHYMFLLNLNELSQDPILPNTARALHFKDCRKFPKYFSETKFLRILDFSACTINELPDSISQLSLLKYLNVSGMRSGKLPKSLSKLHHLQALTLSRNNDLIELPSYICEFLKLQYLDLHGCSKLKKLPDDIHKHKELQHLNLSDCTSLESLPSFSSQSGGLQKLSFLNVSHCSQLVKLLFLEEKLEKQSDHYLPNMVHLNMSFCPKLQELPTGLFKHMRKLLFLNFSGCTSLEVLPDFVEHDTGCSMLEVLDLSGCAKLPVLPESSTELRELRCLNLSGCSKLRNFLKLISRWKFGRLEYLNISGVGAKGDPEAPGTSAEDQSSQDPNKELELGMLQEDIITQGLFRLKYLSIGGFTLYSEQGIARMVDLLTLPNFNVRLEDDGRCSNILILQQILDVTHSQLNIKCLENVVSSEEVKQLELDMKPQFHSLSLEWSLSGTGSSYSVPGEEALRLELDRQQHLHALSSERSLYGIKSSVQHEPQAKASAVLDNLRPHRCLQSLSIKGYIGTAFPDWVNKMNDTLPNLVKLVLSDMEECDSIPAFGHLPNLQELQINNMPRLRDARIGPCKKLRRLSLVALPMEATVHLFYTVIIKTEVQRVESSYGCDEEMAETGQESYTVSGSLLENQVTGKPSEILSGDPSKKGKIQELKGWFKALKSGNSGGTREKVTSASALSEESQLSWKLSSDCSEVASAASLELDYLKIERCNYLKLHPSLPKSKVYFIKNSSLSPALDEKEASSFSSEHPHAQCTEGCSHSGQGTSISLHEDATQKSTPILKSKMYIEGSSENHFHRWTGLISTHLDELIITDCRFDYSEYIHSEGERTISKHDFVDNIYGLSQSCATKLEKLNLHPHPVYRYGEEQSLDNENTLETFIGRTGSQVPYIDTGEVALFSVKPIEGGMFCSSNISLLYKHHEAQISSLVIKNLENVKRPDEVQELVNYQQLRSVHLVWSRSDSPEDSSTAQDKAVLQNLRPHQVLETLQVEGYGVDERCCWMMNINSYLPNLVTVKLSNIVNCQRLPPLGQLANLEVLHISDMPSLREVDRHDYGDEQLFRKLRELKLSRMENLEEWPTATPMPAHDEHQLSQRDGKFSNLQVLAIVKCPRMRFVPAFPGSRECTLVESSSVLASFEPLARSSKLALITLKITDSGSSSDIEKFLQGSVNLEHLTIDSFIDLTTFPEPIRECRSLKTLLITNCWNFSALPEWLGELTSLQKLEVQATKLKCLPQSIQCLTALESLVLDKCYYKLRARCTSGEDKDMIKHIKIVQTTQVPLMNLNPSDITLLQKVTSSQFVDLHVGGLEEDIGLKELNNLELQTKKELSSLSLHWLNASVERGMQNKAVFEKLQPHDGLEILCIKNYAGADFPPWMTSLPNLVKLEMDGTQFEHLHLDQLYNFRELCLSNVQFGYLHLDRLQNLRDLYLYRVQFEHLHLDQLPNLRELCLHAVQFGHLHLDRLHNLGELYLYKVRSERLHLDQLSNLREMFLCDMEFGHHHLDQLQKFRELKLSEELFEYLHLYQLQNLQGLYLSNVKFDCIPLHQLQNLEELHLSQIECLGSNQPACIECVQPLVKLRKIVMSEIDSQELKISFQGEESDENLFPGLQHLEMELCENLRFQPFIPRSTRYIISGRVEVDEFSMYRMRGLFLFPSFNQVMGLTTPRSTCRMEIKNTAVLSSQTWEGLQHLELLNITELMIENCIDHCPLPKCILGWKSLRKLEILRCEEINSLPEWLGEMACLTELVVETYWMHTLHPCIQRLTNLQALTLSKCTKMLKERCRESGDHWIYIRHIPHIQITDRNGDTEIISSHCTEER